MDSGINYQNGDFQSTKDGTIQNADSPQLVETPIAPTSEILSSDKTKRGQSVLPQISGILDSAAQVLFGVSSIKNGQSAQIPTDSILNEGQLELNQPVQRNNTLLFVGLAVVALIILILFFNKK